MKPITFLPWIEENLEKVNWNYLSKNVSAISILEDNLDKRQWSRLSHNHEIIDKHPQKERFVTLVK